MFNNLAKTDESTQAQLKAIDGSQEVHAVKSHKPKSKYTTNKSASVHTQHKPWYNFNFNFAFKGCMRCGDTHDKSETCPASTATCRYCGVVGHCKKACMKCNKNKTHEIVEDPHYHSQDIHLSDYSDSDDSDSDTQVLTL